jgi:hypothetical protein
VSAIVFISVIAVFSVIVANSVIVVLSAIAANLAVTAVSVIILIMAIVMPRYFAVNDGLPWLMRDYSSAANADINRTIDGDKDSW